MTCLIIAEIGINHNGNLDTALDMAAAAKAAGVDMIKFQKRTPAACVPEAQKYLPKQTPWGEMTYLEYKHRMEFTALQYRAIDQFCREINLPWFASCWDRGAVDFIEQFQPPYYKVASASLTDDDLLRHIRGKRRPIILSTGGSTIKQIDHAVVLLGSGLTNPLTLMHCCSAYPAYNDELNLRVIQTLANRYDLPVGYSGHELATLSTVAAVVLGATMVERHLTLDRCMWGSDQGASLEPHEFAQLVSDIRFVEAAMGDGVKRVLPREVPVMEKLRRVIA